MVVGINRWNLKNFALRIYSPVWTVLLLLTSICRCIPLTEFLCLLDRECGMLSEVSLLKRVPFWKVTVKWGEIIEELFKVRSRRENIWNFKNDLIRKKNRQKSEKIEKKGEIKKIRVKEEFGKKQEKLKKSRETWTKVKKNDRIWKVNKLETDLCSASNCVTWGKNRDKWIAPFESSSSVAEITSLISFSDGTQPIQSRKIQN